MLENVTLVFDVDGTLCPIKKKEERYEDLIPYRKIVDRLREYKAEGAKIILHTSRNMRTYNGNPGLINANTAKIMLAWLDKWEIPYDEIVYCKPWAGPHGIYVDDRSVRPDEFLAHSMEELEAICNDSRKDLNG